MSLNDASLAIFSRIGFKRSMICKHASSVASPYMSELAEAAVGDAFGTFSVLVSRT